MWAGGGIIFNPTRGLPEGNDGVWWTRAILFGGPAIDVGTKNGCPATDQRGITRPQGPAYDIGAHEFLSPTGQDTLDR